MKALRNFAKLFSRNRDNLKTTAQNTQKQNTEKRAKQVLKEPKKKTNQGPGRTYKLKPNGRRAGHDPYAHGGCRVRGGRQINWVENAKNQGLPMNKIKRKSAPVPQE